MATEETTGYDKLADLFSSDSDTAIFRSFRYCSHRILIQLQAELINDWADLQRLIAKNRSSEDAEKVQFTAYIRMLRGPHEGADAGEQYELELKVRSKYREYGTRPITFTSCPGHRVADRRLVDKVQAVQDFRYMQSLPHPSTTAVGCLRNYLDRSDGGAMFLDGVEAYTWSRKHEYDLVWLHDHIQNRDLFSSWIAGWILPRFHRVLGQKYRDKVALLESGGVAPVQNYSDESIATVAGVFSTILASMLLTLPPFGLYFIRNPVVQMAVIVVLTFTFITVLALLAKASRAEIFATAAAFTAVQIVFVANVPRS